MAGRRFVNGRVAALTATAMIAFAGNSLLCRVALQQTTIDPATFTTVRLLAGALTLWGIAHLAHRAKRGGGNWWSAAVLFAYAACFSFAYVDLSAATGALLLFGAVQATMIGYGLRQGERLTGPQWLGFVAAMGGLVGLLLPGLTAPPLAGALLMILAGVAWGAYSLRGKGAGDPILITTGNFVRAVVFAVVLSVWWHDRARFDSVGLCYAVASGALASGIGYAVWYAVLPSLKSTTAATVQLSVPVITAFGGVVLLSEMMSARLAITSVAILGGIALVIRGKAST